MKVELAFDLSLTDPTLFFTLDDATRGALDNTTFTLAGDVVVDVTEWTRDVSTRRGRSQELDKFTAGNASITLDNRDRRFDPTYADGPYYGSILPGKQFNVLVDSQPLFRGNVEDWNLDYDVSGDSVASVSGVDAFAVLAGQTVTPGTATAELTSARVASVLTDVGWPATQRRISTGAATLDADVVEDDTNALAYLQKVELSEPGEFFVSADGLMTFLSRTDLQDASGAVAFGGTALPYVGIGVDYGSEMLVNSASVTWMAGTAVAGTAVSSDATSQAAYGVKAATYDTLLGSEADAQDLADWIVARRKDPQFRIKNLTVNLDGLTAAEQDSVLGLELGGVCRVEFTPNAVGSAVVRYATVDAIEHSATPARHDVTFTLSQTLAGLILNDAVLGTLGDNYLAY